RGGTREGALRRVASAAAGGGRYRPVVSGWYCPAGPARAEGGLGARARGLGGVRRRPEGGAGLGTAHQRIDDGVDRTAGEPDRAGAASAAALCDRWQSRAARRARDELARDARATLYRAQAAQPGTARPPTCARRAPRRVSSDRVWGVRGA